LNILLRLGLGRESDASTVRERHALEGSLSS
jgi:hypothetical protein